MRARASVPFLLMLMLGCSGTAATSECEGILLEQCLEPDAGTPDGGVPSDAPLIVDVAWLKARLDDMDVQPIDARISGYDSSRIPGAVQLTPSDLSTTREGVAGQLMAAVDAQPVLQTKGVRDDAIAVVYGTSPEYDPARIVWALRHYGHNDVRYLDGGFAAWVAADGAVDSEPASVEPTEYTITDVDEDLRVTGDWVLSQLGDAPYDMPLIQLVDARSVGEYDSGHIPSARNIDWGRNLDTGFLQPRSELEALYEGFSPAITTVTYCASGRRGSFAWLTLTALGYDDVRLYDGSWNEWGTGGFPVEQ